MFEEYGYKVLEKLSQNLQGGRITYKAIEIATQTDVVIKQFRFATSQDWSAYKQVEREINVLKELKHSGIPRYLNVFDSTDGICLVQEYKNASNLSFPRTFSSEEIKKIAIQLLEILIYLQNRIPPIIHRDLKPENILVDEQLHVYLVDFGFARIGSGEVTALSSMVAGTTGFMPPEQLLNRSLTEASDLYGLGATLICLLIGITSIQLSNLVQYDFHINYKYLLSRYSLRFINWLDQMVEPDFTKRFPNAQTALNALIPLDLIRVPEIRLDKLELEFTATRIGEKRTQIVTVSNEIPETVLQGKWSVSPHTNDPPHTPDSHAWIRFFPKEFEGNRVKCQVTVDTSQLKTDKDYEREIVLTSNARQENYYLRVRVRTAPLPVAVKKPPYQDLAVICVLATIASAILEAISVTIVGATTIGTIVAAIVVAIVAAIGGVIGGVIFGARIRGIGLSIVAAIGVVIGVVIGVAISGAIGLPIGFSIVGAIGWAIGLAIGGTIADFNRRKFNNGITLLYCLLTYGLGTAIGTGISLSFTPYVILAIAATSLPLASMLLYPPIQHRRLVAKYRQQEQHLIEP